MALKIPGYRIIRKINHGGMSTVYLAIQISVGRVVALKVMNPGLTNDTGFNERFQREATIVGQLSHPNIIAIYDIGREENLNFIAMDYLPGGSVHDKMIKGISASEVLSIIKDIANALDHAHEKGYVHRDIKPENILFRADNSAVLTDFGVAKGMIGVSRMTHVGTVVGTPHYMSPEQARGQIVDARSDLYSLGVVFYEMLTGTLPYPAEDAVTIVLKHMSAPIPKLPRQYQAYQKLLNTFLAKEPAQRFQRGSDISNAIELLEKRAPAAALNNLAQNSTSIGALFNALMHSIQETLYWRWQKIKPIFGLKISEPKNQNQHRSNNTPTLFASRVQHGFYASSLAIHKKSILKIIFSIVFLSIIMWSTFSVLLQNKFKHKLNLLPYAMQSATHKTANVFLPQKKLPEQSKKIITQASSSAHSYSADTILAAKSETEHLLLSGIDFVAHSSQPTTTPFSVVTINELRAEISSPPLVAAAAINSSIEAPIETYALTIKVKPEKSQIRILNIANKYKDGITLPPGHYHIEMTQTGYTTQTEWVDIKDQATVYNFVLTESVRDPNQGSLPPALKNSSNEKIKPEYIRIPAGNFLMGDDKDATSSPRHKVFIAKPFAISKYEITFSEYDYFVQATNRAQPGDNGWGRDLRPVINVSWLDAQAYVQWLSKTTGKKYRLPTEAEWEYVARAGSLTPYWWGDAEQDAKGRANCRRGCYSSYSGLFGSKTAPVGTYAANAFGVFDTAGNVAEWVQDCYQDYYDTNSSSAALNNKECSARVVRGGSTKNNVKNITATTRDYFPPETYTETLGFRVVLDY
jgi:serine/threonine-protein kinase PpkA